MAWQDRHYYRDRSESTGNPLMWLLTGSIPLFTAFDIRVRAHASMLVYAALVLLFGLGTGFTWQDRVQNVTVLFAIVLLHEFGHCFTARWVGGEANEIVMHPLGGLALASPPRRPLPTFLTVAGGPAVNVLICLLCGSILWWMSGWLPWNPVLTIPIRPFQGWLDVWRYAFWIYQISWTLLLFNLLPIFPLDGGQMVQAALWPKLGHYKSMLISCSVGMVGAALGGMVALATLNIGLAILAAFGFLYCLNLRRMLIATGPEDIDSTDYSAAYDINAGQPSRRRRGGWTARRAASRARKLADQERAEQSRIDAILAKVSANGMQSLSWLERRTLKNATERQRERDLERSKLRRGV
jgi:Zn-dependent protease